MPMRPRYILQALGPLLIVAAGVAALGWLRSLGTPPGTSTPAASPPPVRTRALGPVREQFEIHVGGRVVPRREVTLSAEVAGRVIARPGDRRAGQHVTEGTLLLQLDPADHELELKKIDSQLDRIDLELEQLVTETSGNQALVALASEKRKVASGELARIESLLKQNVATPVDRDRAKRSELDARLSLQELENRRSLLPVLRQQLQTQRKGLLAQQEQARRNLERTRLVAPFDGLLTHDATEVGDFVQPGDILLKIEETAVVEIECQLRSDQLDWLRDSRSADGEDNPFEVPVVAAIVTSQDSPDPWRGRLTRFRGQGVDPHTRTVPCRVLVERRQHEKQSAALMRGMYVTVTFPVRPKTRLIEIPAEAVRADGQVWSVSDNRLVVHRIKAARVLKHGVLVRADETRLKTDDRVVVSPLVTTFDGMPVIERRAVTTPEKPTDGSDVP
ncbi:MAG: HlyD family efflux transporter periplasmic adaptor subunit [Planctomycetaceae bacterium]|nr:HlyD family efflux transporter periplasmic adaptor subunit [Planctomycetaceae bacterium]